LEEWSEIGPSTHREVLGGQRTGGDSEVAKVPSVRSGCVDLDRKVVLGDVHDV
jgi:hypothetical protein